MNKLVIIGNLTRDPELRTTPTGKDVCSLDIAVNRRRRADGQPEADYFRANAWGELAKLCARYLVKGQKVMVTGPVSLSKRERDGKFYASLEVFAEDVEFLSPKPANNGAQEVTPNDDFPF